MESLISIWLCMGIIAHHDLTILAVNYIRRARVFFALNFIFLCVCGLTESEVLNEDDYEKVIKSKLEVVHVHGRFN